MMSPVGRKTVLSVFVLMAVCAVSTAVHRLISRCGLVVVGQRR